MKRFVAAIILAFGFLGTISSQEKFIDHLAIGINYGTTSMSGAKPADYLPFLRETDGAGIEIAAQITDWLDARVGFSTTMHGSNTYNYSVEGVPNGNYVTRKLEVISRYGALSGNLFFDFYPFGRTTFHFTAGAYVGSSTMLRIYNRTEVPEELASYNTGVLEMHGLTIPTDFEGRIAARLKMPAVRPYAGIGISTGRMDSNIVIFSARLGAMYKGNRGMTVVRPDGNDVEIDYWPSDSYLARMVAWSRKCPVAPMLTLSLYVRLF